MALARQDHAGDLVAALDASADACIAKPFSMGELHAQRARMADARSPELSDVQDQVR
jgi:DNA-binding response OmpR family regulator